MELDDGDRPARPPEIVLGQLTVIIIGKCGDTGSPGKAKIRRNGRGGRRCAEIYDNDNCREQQISDYMPIGCGENAVTVIHSLTPVLLN
ncbi:hypothetical protein [Victivallis vadensis]|uniref:hypothetical protein n=1 Tax=Victivallis vadensis TaxID=172901 RepID=UPI000E32686C|nr:hypothetical protein [Victivallis vadensis]